MIALKKSKLLGFNLIDDNNDQCDPIISAKISAPPPVLDVIENPGGTNPAGNGAGGAVIDVVTNGGSSGGSAGGNTFNLRPNVLNKLYKNNLNSTDAASFLSGNFAKNIWAQGLIGSGSVEGNSATRGTEYDLYGVILGSDILSVGKRSRFGLFGAYTSSDSQVKGNKNNNGDSDFYQVGLYFSNKFYNNVNLTGVLSAGWGDFDTSRATNTGIAKGSFDANGYFADAELSYDKAVVVNNNKVTLSPFGRVEYGKTDRESYTETGPGAMRIKSEDIEKLTTVVGGRAQAKLQNNKLQFTPSARVGWAHQHSDNAAGLVTNSSLQPVTAAPLSNNLTIDRDSVRVNVDTFITNRDFQDNGALYVSYRGDFASNASSNMFSVGLKVVFG